MSTRLSLTWANKEKGVLPDESGGFTWVSRDDPRLTEVRRLSRTGTVGDTLGTPADNLLIQGDAYHALRALTRIPEYASEYKGRVKQVYIDPPFNTGQTFDHYDDKFEHSIWLTLIRDYLATIHTLLSEDGSVWLHLDDEEVHRARLVLDEVFGASNFVAEICWEKADSPNSSATYFSIDQDFILVYAKDKDRWRPNRLARTAAVDAKYTNPDDDPRGRWFGDNLSASKPYSKGVYPIKTPSGRIIDGPPDGGYWRISEDRLWELHADDRIWWGPNQDQNPKFKRFLDDVGGLVPRTFWTKSDVGSNRTGKAEIKALFPGRAPFATPKPERLLHRVLSIGSDHGDIVLDCFAGSGTTAAVAHKLQRRWVTVEAIEETVDTFTKPRLSRVVDGTDRRGVSIMTDRVAKDPESWPENLDPEEAKRALSITNKVFDDDARPLHLDMAKALAAAVKADQKSDEPSMNAIEARTALSVLKSLEPIGTIDVSRQAKSLLKEHLDTRDESTVIWEHGGGFATLRVEPTAYVQHAGLTLLTPDVAGPDLTDYVAANLGFTRSPERDGVDGVRGRAALVVVDGSIDENVAKSALLGLNDDEVLFLVGRSYVPDVSLFLREKRPGSRVLKAPSDLIERARVIR